LEKNAYMADKTR